MSTLDWSSVNAQALNAVHPGAAMPSRADRVVLVDGCWRVEDGTRCVTIHSRDPHREADRQLGDLFTHQPNATLIVVIGLGLGFVLDGLERRSWQGRVLVIEPLPDTIAPWMARRDWQEWIRSKRLQVLVGPDYEGASECRSLFGDGAVEPALLVNQAIAQLVPEAAARAQAVARRLHSDARANAQARKKHGARYLLNTLANLRALATEGDVATLSGAFPGVPAIVVGAGPSLDHAIEDLRHAQQGAIIITVDTALRALLGAAVQPHFVVALDPGEANARHLWDLPPCPETFLVSEASMTPVGLEHFRGRTFLFSVSDHQPWPWLASHGQPRGRLRAWGSVLTSAFDLALRLGCDPVIFAGADLAFTGDRPYARGVAYEEDWRRLADWGVPFQVHWRETVDSWPRIEEPDVDGVPTRTAAHLVTFRNWLVEQINREKGRRFINATGAGILHGSRVQHRTMREVVASFSHSDLRPLVRGRYRPASGESLVCAAESLLAEMKSGATLMSSASEDLLRTWESFADGLSRARIANALSSGLGDGTGPELRAKQSVSHGAEVNLDAEWMTPVATNLSLVWFQVPPVRMEAIAPHTRMFRCRTTVGRVFACATRMPNPAVTEDGLALRPGAGLDALQAGEYFIWRDEIYFKSSDGSDPRENGRTYAILLPQGVAYLECLPLHQILTNGI